LSDLAPNLLQCCLFCFPLLPIQCSVLRQTCRHCSIDTSTSYFEAASVRDVALISRILLIPGFEPCAAVGFLSSCINIVTHDCLLT
jgi:hypothetical protein